MVQDIKKTILVSIVTLIAALLCSIPVFAADSSEYESVAPDITSIQVVNSEVQKDGYLDIIMDIVEDGTGVNYIRFDFSHVITETTDRSSSDYVWRAFWDEGKSYQNVKVYKIDAKGKERLFTDNCIFTGKYRFHIPISFNIPEACVTADRWIYILLCDRANPVYNDEGGIYYWNNNSMQLSVDEDKYYGSGKYKKFISEYYVNDLKHIVRAVETDFDVIEFSTKGYDFYSNLSSDNLVEKIEKLENGGQGIVKIDGDRVLSSEALEALKGKDAETIYYTDGYKWTFNGKDIGNNTKNIDLHLSIKSTDSGDISSRLDLLKLDFADNGELPGKAKISVNNSELLKSVAKANELELYYVDGEKYIPVDSSFAFEKDGDKTWCSFDVIHNSSYVISTKPAVTGYSRSYKYTGKSIKPSVKVIAKGKTLKEGTHYKVSYSNNKNVGRATIKITGIGTLKGSKSVNFSILPKGTSISSLSRATKAFTVKWKKQSTQTSGYQILYSTSSKFKSGNKTVTVSSSKTTAKKITKLKAKKKYYVKVRTYKTVNGTKYYSSWSSAKAVTTK